MMPHQLKALSQMHNGCILRGSLGSGKTMTALAYYRVREFPKRLIVITTAKKRDAGDWEAEARMFGLFPEVRSWNELTKYSETEGAFFVFDEQRVVGSGPWAKAFSKVARHNSWILLSATPGDSWMDYIPVFIANGFYRNRKEFLEEHVVFNPFVKFAKVMRYTGTAKLQRNLNAILVDMPYEKHTVRHVTDIYCEYDREKYDTVWRKRWNYLENRPVQNVSELFSLLRRVTNSDPSRIANIRALLERHARLIVFYNFDYELEILRSLGGITASDEGETCSQNSRKPLLVTGPGRTGGNSGQIIVTAVEPGSTSGIRTIPGSFAVAEWNGHKHEQIPLTDRWAYLVQYSSGSEGWNCTDTDAMAFWSQTYSYRNFEQSKGRIDRLDTPYTDLYYYVLRSSSGIDNGISATLSRKKNFNEARWLKSAV
jgi:hypothetical protein